MELKKCDSCGKFFFGTRSMSLCPICTVAAKGKELVEGHKSSARAPQTAMAVGR